MIPVTTHERAHQKETMEEERSTPRSPRPAGLSELGFGVMILALVVVVLVNYGDNLLDTIDGLSGFSISGLLVLVLGAGAIIIAVILPALANDESAAVTTGIAGPVMRGTARQNRALEILTAEKLRLLRAIRDLDFDYDMGKLPDSIYIEQRVYLIERAIAVLRRIAGLESEISAQQDRIAAALQAYREKH